MRLHVYHIKGKIIEGSPINEVSKQLLQRFSGLVQRTMDKNNDTK